MNRKPNFIVDPDNFQLLRDDVGVGKIVELRPPDASLIVPHIASHPETIYAACSGVNLIGQYGLLRHEGQQIAVEWVRQETRPQQNEPGCNVYRYIFGLTSDGRCIGYEVTRWSASAETGQVADHWMKFDDVVKRHFPELL